GWILLEGDKKRRAFHVDGEPQIAQAGGSLSVHFSRSIPGVARQRIAYRALSNGVVIVSSRWEALKDIEVAECVDHPFRWVSIERFISRPETTQPAPGIWRIDGKLQLQVLGGPPGEWVEGGVNGSVQRHFSAKAGMVFQ